MPGQQHPPRILHGLHRFTLLLALLLLSVFSHAQELQFSKEEQDFIRQHPTIIVGGQQDWAPMDFVEHGENSGVAKDYLELISERTGLKFDVVTGYTWEQLLQMFIAQELDMLPMLSWSTDRAPHMHFTQPYIRLRHYAFVQSDRKGIKDIEDLYGKQIAIPKGYTLLNKIAQAHPQILIREVPTMLDAIDAVVTGQVDALVANTPLIAYYLKENTIQGLKPVFPISFDINEIHMASRKDWPVLRDILQKALNSIDHQRRKQILERWVGPLTASSDESQDSLVLNPLERIYLQEKGEITACIDPHWMPYEGFVNGKNTGISSDYLRYFSAQLNTPIRVIETQSWKQSLLYAKQRKCDILALASNRPERREFMDFTPPYVETSLALATRDDAWFYSDFSEIQGERVGIIHGYSPAGVIRKQYPQIELVEINSIEEGLSLVREGKLLGFLNTVATLSYYIQQESPGELKISGKFDYDWDVGIATRNDEPLLGLIFNQLVATTPESVHHRIRNNWLAVRYEKAIDYSILWKALAVFAVILFLLTLRYRQLARHRQEIQEKNTELATINAQLEQQTEAARHMAFHDLLTGLPNRFQLLERLDHAMKLAQRQESKVAVLFLDLDRFKYVNDSLGHHIGDELLQVVALRVMATLRKPDTLARLGGDEFVILLESVADDNSPGKVAQQIIDVLQQPLEVSGYRLNISASIGIAVYPDDCTDIHALIKNADNAMYQAKARGRNTFRYYTQSLSEESERRLKTESALREALQQNQFSLVFQPIVDLKSLEVSHAEALLRWHHPELGMVSPEYFIPIAEENGLIHEIGLWVFEHACQVYKHWLSEGLALNSIAINVSSVQFNKGDLAQRFQAILEREGLDARSVEIEITERYLMDQTEQTLIHLDALKKAGHLISVDDFGVGYSSMSYMKRLPLDIIKIDRSFISDIPIDINDKQISTAIIALSHNLGYRVVAEGVENEAQLSFLEKTRCDFAQGYFFSKPVPEEQFIATTREINTRLRRQNQQTLDLVLS